MHRLTIAAVVVALLATAGAWADNVATGEFAVVLRDAPEVPGVVPGARIVYDTQGERAELYASLLTTPAGTLQATLDIATGTQKLTLLQEGVFKVLPSGFAALSEGGSGAGGVGLSARFWRFSDNQYLWADAGALSENFSNSRWFVGASTELGTDAVRGGFGYLGGMWGLYVSTDLSNIFKF